MSLKDTQFKLLLPRKYDGVVEAAHYTKTGKIDWVRAYERRGPTWSDRVLLDRDALLERLQNGKRFYAGQRLENLASEFELGQKLQLVDTNKGQIIITEKTRQKLIDHLEGVSVV